MYFAEFPSGTMLVQIAQILSSIQEIIDKKHLSEYLIKSFLSLLELDAISFYSLDKRTSSYIVESSGTKTSLFDNSNTPFRSIRMSRRLMRFLKKKDVTHLTRETIENFAPGFTYLFNEYTHLLIFPLASNEYTSDFILASLPSHNILPSSFFIQIESLGRIISSAYEARVQKKLQSQRLEFLRSIEGLPSKSLDSLFRSFFHSLGQLFPFRFVSIWLYNRLDNTLVLRSFYPDRINGKPVTFNAFDKKVLDCGECISGLVIKSKDPQMFCNIHSFDEFSNKKFIKKYDLQWVASFPILGNGNEPYGIVNIWPESHHVVFDSRSLDNILSYISPLATKIRLASLSEIKSLPFSYDAVFKSMIEFTDQMPSWNRLAKLIANQMQCEACSIFIKQPDDLLHLKGSAGVEVKQPYQNVIYKIGEGLTGHTFQKGIPLIYYPEIKDKYVDIYISKHFERLRGSAECRSLIFMPVFDNAKNAIGVIRCNNKEQSQLMNSGRFTQEDIDRLHLISKLVSNLYLKVLLVQKQELEREASLYSLEHEILSPVDGLCAHAEWLSSHLSNNTFPLNLNKHKVNIKIGDMRQISALMKVIVGNMGKFDGNFSISAERFSLYESIQTCIGFLFDNAKINNIDIKVGHMWTPKVVGDPLQIMRVFYNILRNAIKYHDKQEESRYIKVYSKESENNCKIFFEDNGIGVIFKEKEHIFKKFARGTNARRVFPEGSGLGLSYCFNIMRLHGGKVLIDNRHISKPTVFIVEYPLENKGQ